MTNSLQGNVDGSTQGRKTATKWWWITVVAVCAFMTFRLWLVADLRNNWPGFWFSSLHVWLVGVGALLAVGRVTLKTGASSSREGR
jgi:hypothetical protein